MTGQSHPGGPARHWWEADQPGRGRRAPPRRDGGAKRRVAAGGDGVGPLMAVIQKVASDPNFDVEKLRELRAIQKEWEADQARKAYFAALSRAQSVMPVVKKNKHTHFGQGTSKEVDYWYADLAAVVEAVKGPLSSEGFSLLAQRRAARWAGRGDLRSGARTRPH